MINAVLRVRITFPVFRKLFICRRRTEFGRLIDESIFLLRCYTSKPFFGFPKAINESGILFRRNIPSTYPIYKQPCVPKSRKFLRPLLEMHIERLLFGSDRLFVKIPRM